MSANSEHGHDAIIVMSRRTIIMLYFQKKWEKIGTWFVYNSHRTWRYLMSHWTHHKEMKLWRKQVTAVHKAHPELKVKLSVKIVNAMMWLLTPVLILGQILKKSWDTVFGTEKHGHGHAHAHGKTDAHTTSAHEEHAVLPPKPARRPIRKTKPIMPTSFGTLLYHLSWDVPLYVFICLILCSLTFLGYGFVNQRIDAFKNNHGKEIQQSLDKKQAQVFAWFEKDHWQKPTVEVRIEKVAQKTGACASGEVEKSGFCLSNKIPNIFHDVMTQACVMETHPSQFRGCPIALAILGYQASDLNPNVACNLEEGEARCGIVQMRDKYRIDFDERHYGMTFDECQNSQLCSFRFATRKLISNGLLEKTATHNERYRAFLIYDGVESFEACQVRGGQSLDKYRTRLDGKFQYSLSEICSSFPIKQVASEKAFVAVNN